MIMCTEKGCEGAITFGECSSPKCPRLNGDRRLNQLDCKTRELELRVSDLERRANWKPPAPGTWEHYLDILSDTREQAEARVRESKEKMQLRSQDFALESRARVAAESALSTARAERAAAMAIAELRGKDLATARKLLGRCSDEMNYDEFDDPIQQALQRHVKDWLSSHPAPAPVTSWTCRECEWLNPIRLTACQQCASVATPIQRHPPRKLSDEELVPVADANPVPMGLKCPVCELQHVDAVDVDTGIDWSTRLHKTHLCLGCGHLWKPAPYATVGVQPAPVAAPCAGCAEKNALLKQADAPCAGCAEKNALLRQADAELAALESVTADRDEWREQHENLLVMYRDSEAWANALRQAIDAAVFCLESWSKCGSSGMVRDALSALKAAWSKP